MPDNKAKIHVLNSMMKNPRISRMISDAWDAPVGSTKRKQVRSVIESVNKLSSKKFNDGKGGTGTSFKKMDYLPYNPARTDTYDKLIIMPSAPSMINDGKGGPANQSMSSYSSPLQSRETPNMSVGAPSAPSWSPSDKGKTLISGPSQVKYYYPETIEKDPTSNKLYGKAMPTGDIGYKPYTPEEAAQKGLLREAGHWAAGAAAPTVGKYSTLALLGTGALAKTAVKNVGALAQNIGSSLLGESIVKPAQYTGVYDTAEGKVIDSIMTPHGAAVQQPTTGPKMSVGDPYATLQALGAPSYKPEDKQGIVNRDYVAHIQSGASPELALKEIKNIYGMEPSKDTIAQAKDLQKMAGKPAYTSAQARQLYDKYVSSGYKPDEAAAEVQRITGTALPAGYAGLVSTVSGMAGRVGPEQEGADKYYTALVDTGSYTPTEASEKVQSEMGITPTQSSAISGPSTAPGGAASLSEIAGRSISPTAFVSDIMSRDLPTLRALFPGVPDDQLPHGASLAGQIADLQDSLKKETGLNDWLNQRQRLIDAGQTLPADLTGYIQSRDEYIKGVDKMIDGTKNTLLNTDVSDPQVEKRMGDYMNYLYVLKGRQNQRYTDFLNSSIDQHNAQLNEVDNMYTQAKDLYTNELATKTAITQEEFQRWSTLLSDTWNAIHQQNDPAAQLDYQYKVAQINKMNADTAKIAAESLDSVNGTKYWVQQKDYKDQFVDDKGNLLNINLANQMLNAKEQGYDQKGIVSLVEQGIATSLANAKDFDTAYSDMKKINDNLYGISKNIDPLLASGLTTGMYDKGKSIIRQYIKDNSGKFINAIKELTPSKGFDWEFDWTKAKGDDWVNKYASQGLNKDFLKDLYNMYTDTVQKVYPNDSAKSRSIFTGFDASGENPVMEINDKNIDDVADRITYGISKMGVERIPQPAQ